MRLLRLAFVLALLAATARAADGEETDAVLRGRLVDPDGVGVVARIFVYGDGATGEAWSSEDGSYEVRLPAGAIQHAQAGTDATAPRRVTSVVACIAPACPTLVAGETTWLNATLPWSATLGGRVLLPDGTPAVGAAVWAHRVVGDEREGALNDTTDGMGRYRIDIDPGAIAIMAVPAPSTHGALLTAALCERGDGSDCFQLAPREVAEHDIVLAPGAILRGRVLERVTHASVENAHVRASREDGPGPSAESNATGDYVITAPAGNYSLSVIEPGGRLTRDASCERCVTLVTNETTYHDLVLPRIVTFAGRIDGLGAASDAASSRATVELSNDGFEERVIVLGHDPTFAFRAPEGLYAVTADIPGILGTYPCAAGSDCLRLGDDAVTTILLTVPPPRSLSEPELSEEPRKAVAVPVVLPALALLVAAVRRRRA